MINELKDIDAIAQNNERLEFEPTPKCNIDQIPEEELKKWQRECEIDSLRRKIRQDMMDYKLLHTDQNIGVDGEESYLFRSGSDPYFHGVRNFFALYLEKQIDNNLMELKKLIQGE